MSIGWNGSPLKVPRGGAASNSKQGGGAKAEVNDYEVVQTKDGGYKRRRIGATGSWTYLCDKHGNIRAKCMECQGGSICQHKRQRSRCKNC